MLTCLLSALRLECLGSSAPCELFVIITIYVSAFLQGLRCFSFPFSISLLELMFAACDFQGHGMINILPFFFCRKGRALVIATVVSFQPFVCKGVTWKFYRVMDFSSCCCWIRAGTDRTTSCCQKEPATGEPFKINRWMHNRLRTWFEWVFYSSMKELGRPTPWQSAISVPPASFSP